MLYLTIKLKQVSITIDSWSALNLYPRVSSSSLTSLIHRRSPLNSLVWKPFIEMSLKNDSRLTRNRASDNWKTFPNYYLRITNFEVNVNNTPYDLSVYREFHQGEEVDPIQNKKNEDVLYDLDTFGFRVPMNKTDVASGEVVFGYVINRILPLIGYSFPVIHSKANSVLEELQETIDSDLEMLKAMIFILNFHYLSTYGIMSGTE
ncbi:hypothetical protein GCK72_022652 [Caenorhabditis remanei]|uniref:Uncharacterized protein n=1 Tax=Caenorhabditis remanei TaxID=31234 RepID=A0A6A5FUQ4_CAERE|nr:hypothetical protein GCK72_022652 [Caenorhabditis remanei]KAF1746199.1 hypothetical protein GCK72_022652 [Caenorhabditis remanei]